MNILELINIGSNKLKYKGIPSYKLDSEILISKVLDKKRENILINLDKEIDSKSISYFNNLIKRRSAREPIAYILNEKEFWSKEFEVNNSTLIPRAETELMVEKIVQIYKDKSISILDIGSGCGCILIGILTELRNSTGLGIDISKQQLKLRIRIQKDTK